MKSAFLWVFLALLVALGVGSVFGYNSLVREQEAVRTAWSQVENVYQRRLDLIPNLVATVKGYATHEHDVLLQVTEARNRAAKNTNNGPVNDPEKFKMFQESQAALSSALSRLLVVIERYPDLKANQNFLALQTQLEGSENRIAVERRRFNEVAVVYNTHLRQFPTVLLARILGFDHIPYFQAQSDAEKVPEVKF